MRATLFQNRVCLDGEKNRKAEIERLIQSIPQLDEALNGDYFQEIKEFKKTTAYFNYYGSLVCFMFMFFQVTIKKTDERDFDPFHEKAHFFSVVWLNIPPLLYYCAASYLFAQLNPKKPELNYQAIVEAIDAIRKDIAADPIKSKFNNFICTISHVQTTSPCKIVDTEVPVIISKEGEKTSLNGELYDYPSLQQWLELNPRHPTDRNPERQSHYQIVFDETTSKAIDRLLMNELKNLRELLAPAAEIAFVASSL